MTRDLGRLSAAAFDVLVIGGGIYGACIAWEAALRGLAVALVEQADFGHATSANSQRIAHGGLRYLQRLDFERMRESIRERRTLLRIAPHLVHPLPCLMPTRGSGLRSRAAMALAFALNDLISWDRNHGIPDETRRIPACRLLSRAACLRLAPELDRPEVTGGALWHDGQIEDSERLTLSFIRSAMRVGAAAANYVRATGLLRSADRVTGVQATDLVTGRRFAIRAGIVLNAAGPWTAEVAPFPRRAGGRTGAPSFLKAVNLLTAPLTSGSIALALESRAGTSRTPGLLFLTPWQGCTVVGSVYSVYRAAPGACDVTEEEVEAFVQDVNLAYPAARLTRRKVLGVQAGLLPESQGRPGRLEPRYRVIDHARLGLRGLISVVGVKYTTARDVAEECIELASRYLGRAVRRRGLSRTTPLYGGDAEGGMKELFAEAARASGTAALPPASRQRLVTRYGTACRELIDMAEANEALAQPLGATPVLCAEVVHAVRHEMAIKLEDVVFRRTGLGSTGFPGAEALRVCADLMGRELGWDAARMRRELNEVEAVFRRHGARIEDAGMASPAPAWASAEPASGGMRS